MNYETCYWLLPMMKIINNCQPRPQGLLDSNVEQKTLVHSKIKQSLSGSF